MPSMFLQAAATVLLAGLGLTVTAQSSTPAIPVLLVAGLTSGAAHGFLYPSLAALVADQTPETRRAAVVGIFSSVFLVGHAGGASVFGFVTHELGYGLMWTVLSGLLFVGFLLSLRLPEARA